MNKPWLHIGLYRPQIPQNTGNIARTCVGLEIPLHIIGKPVFSLEDRYLKRAGLDYWEHLSLTLHEGWEEFSQKYPSSRCYFFSKKGRRNLFDLSFQEEDILIFGQESDGLPPWMLEEFAEQTVFLPMPGKVRSFNLSNTVAVAAFEAYHQIIHQKGKG